MTAWLPFCLGLSLLFSELGLAWWRHAAREPGSRPADGGSLGMLWRVIGGAIATGYIVAAYGLGPALPVGVPWGWIGLGVFATGTMIRWWSIHHLGRFFTVDVALAEDHRVVDTGPYRWVRHPSYTGLLLQFTGLALSLQNGLGLAVMLVPICWALLRRIRVEENALLAKLGPAYAEYTDGTKKLIPLVY